MLILNSWRQFRIVSNGFHGQLDSVAAASTDQGTGADQGYPLILEIEEHFIRAYEGRNR
jgi:hypothetical protein